MRDRSEEEEEEDDGRDIDFFWIEPFFGYSYINLVQFSQDDNFLPDADNKTGNGLAGGVALGFRIYWLALGVRGVAARYSDFYMGSVMLDLALRIPLGPFEPYLRSGIGYGWIGNPDFDSLGNTEVDIHGVVAEAGAGLDIYLTRVLAIGAGVDAAFLNFTRQGVDNCPGTGCTIGSVMVDESGDAVGFQLRAHAHIGLHF